ncbi:glutamate--tRNA ligase [Catelliglobosispora koreensis]|uniref:glutamate--tRNA ligase n=1 Tax=Catelliglobosispora koreensis TaxID=129052 RepID=UPI00038173A1|nr:glutamate--tRNA ligase family protein [Catelliglobosispora koreensis]
MLSTSVIDSLFPADLPETSFWFDRYPPRDFPVGALVTRFSPSPTGHLHIGGIYAAMISKDLATHSGGSFFVRIEDTDQARELAGATAQFARAFAHFRVAADEDDMTGRYGPYTQSARADIYLSFVRHLLRCGHAYLCFASKEDLAVLSERQRNAGVPTGYYGSWAPWRDAADDDVLAALETGRPYVVRFRSPGVDGRVVFTDAIRGRIELNDNINDAVILKSSDSPLRLPTYHLAHAVDDSLMGVNMVVRAEEWLPSVPLHHQLFAALGHPPIAYAHIAQLLKLDGRGKRKLSKRKDPEASVDFYIRCGFPVEPLLHYLRGLANGRLAEMPTAQALAEPIRLAECNNSGALVDLVKLDDMCADYIAALPGEQILDQVAVWAAEFDPPLAHSLAGQRDAALRALAIERDGVANPRKDLRRWDQFRTVYGYFLPDLFSPVTTLEATDLAYLDPLAVKTFAAELVSSYREDPDREAWFTQIRDTAIRCGFAPDVRTFKASPSSYPGAVREAAQIVRVALTGATRSPDLHAVAHALGADEVIARLSHLTTNR